MPEVHDPAWAIIIFKPILEVKQVLPVELHPYNKHPLLSIFNCISLVTYSASIILSTIGCLASFISKKECTLSRIFGLWYPNLSELFALVILMSNSIIKLTI